MIIFGLNCIDFEKINLTKLVNYSSVGFSSSSYKCIYKFIESDQVRTGPPGYQEKPDGPS
jgi:hypothetical protein